MANVSLLTTVAECDAVLAQKATERGVLFVQKQRMEIDLASKMDNAVSVPEDLAIVEGQITTATSNLATLTPGTRAYKKCENLLKGLEIKRNNLSIREEANNPLLVFEMSGDLDLINAELIALDVLVSEITSRKLELSSTGA